MMILKRNNNKSQIILVVTESGQTRGPMNEQLDIDCQ